MTSPVLTEKTFEIDLCPDKPKHMDLGDTRVEVTIKMLTRKEPPPVVMTGLWDAAAPTMLRYQKEVEDAVKKVDDKVDMLIKMKDIEGAEEEAKTLTTVVKGVCTQLQPAVTKLVEQKLAADKRANQNLKEAKIRVGLGISFKTITIALDATRIGVTLGADVHADVMIVKHCYDFCVLVYDALKDEVKLEKEFVKAYDDYIKSRKLKKKAETSTVAAVKRTAQQVFNTWTSNAKVAETARKRYRDKVTELDVDLKKLSGEVAKVEKVVADPDVTIKDREDAKKAAAKLTLKVNTLYNYVTGCQKRQADMGAQLEEALKANKSKTKIDDRTFKERFPDAKTTLEVLKDAEELVHLAKEIADFATSAA